MRNDDFKELVWQKGHELYRDMPWRQDTRPYYVLVSELMLQQTQVSRVIPKFEAFVGRFPDTRSLAQAALADVLELWQGLGYNRRARYLHEAAKMIVNDYGEVFPEDEIDLLRLPGIGKNTAGAIQTYSFNRPVIFIETNIRTVYIHHFFADNFDVEDKQIKDKLIETLDSEHPREFYWALMDYGSWLKQQGIKNTRQSKHYVRQSPLRGSVREVRGMIIKLLVGEAMTELELRTATKADERFETALDGLVRDGLVTHSGAMFHLTK